MKINLKELAAHVAKQDNPAGVNLTVVEVGAVLAQLGNHLRELAPEVALATVTAIIERAGLKSK